MHTTTRRPLAALLAGLIVLALTTVGLQTPAHAGADRRDVGFFSGRVVDRATGDPIKGVTVRVFRINTDTLLGSDVSGSAGKFRINGLLDRDEELDVRVNGSAVHYQTGWIGCAHIVVPTWNDACSYGQGHQTPFRLRHL